jgi:hypothetical protein
MDYKLYCRLIDGDAFEQDFYGFEDLGDVLEEIEALHVMTGFPPSPAECEAWGIASVDGTEFAVAVS